MGRRRDVKYEMTLFNSKLWCSLSNIHGMIRWFSFGVDSVVATANYMNDLEFVLALLLC